MKHATYTKVIAAFLTAGMILGAANLVAAEENDTSRLIKALRSKNIGWRVSSAQLLGKQKETRAIKPLTKMLNNDISYAARMSAAVALAKIGDRSALKALKKAAKFDRDQTVRTVALGAYYELLGTSATIALE